MSVELKLVPARPRGRPSLYDSAYCDRILELASQGCGREEIAGALGVSTKTLSAWMRTHQEFREAMAQAKELEFAWWLAAGREGQFKSGWKASGWLLQMRNRFGCRFEIKAQPTNPSKRKEAVNVEHILDEIERKLSRIADTGKASEISEKPDGGGGGNA